MSRGADGRMQEARRPMALHETPRLCGSVRFKLSDGPKFAVHKRSEGLGQGKVLLDKRVLLGLALGLDAWIGRSGQTATDASVPRGLKLVAGCVKSLRAGVCLMWLKGFQSFRSTLTVAASLQAGANTLQ
jgi:hypothetical protein